MGINFHLPPTNFSILNLAVQTDLVGHIFSACPTYPLLLGTTFSLTPRDSPEIVNHMSLSAQPEGWAPAVYSEYPRLLKAGPIGIPINRQ